MPTQQRTLPSFDHFVSTLGHMKSERPHTLLIEKPSTFPETSKVERHVPLPSPISDAPHPLQRVERASFSHTLNPVEDQPTDASTSSTQSPISPWKPNRTPRDAYEMRQGFFSGMKPLQPRGAIPPALQTGTTLTLRTSSTEQDLTLAGKPRKRSAQACQRCREMKIKCRLQGPGCTTCMRQGLGCTFEPGKNGLRQRRGKRGPDSITNSFGCEPPPRKPVCSNSNNPTERLPTNVFVSLGPRAATGYPLVPDRRQELPGREMLRVSTSLPMTPPAENESERRSTPPRRRSGNSDWAPPSPPDLTIDKDPSTAAPALTTRALQSFYSNVHQRCDGVVLPAAETSIIWKNKTANERMLHYAMLAAGASSCLEHQWSEELEIYARACRGLAEEALRTAGYMFDKTVVQTQMILKGVAEPGPAERSRLT